MLKYLKIYFLCTILNIKELKSYGVDFYIGSIAMFLKNISNLFLIYFIYNMVNTIKGWNINEMILIYSTITISFSIWRCFFINTLNISHYITSGNFDILLIKPINSLFLIFMEGFDEDAWGDLAVGIILFIYISNVLNISIINSIMLFVLSILGGLVFAGLSVLGAILSIVYLGVSNFSDLPYIVYEFAKYPLNIFNPLLLFVFKTIIPIAWISYIPLTNLLKNNSNIYLLFTISLISIILYFITVVIIWNKFLKKYSSSGS